VLDERQRRAEIVEIPAEAAVVEIDHLRARALDQQIGQPDIGVRQAEAFARLAVALEPAADDFAHPRQRLLARGIHAHSRPASGPRSGGCRRRSRNPSYGA
jgi:hypothetical protein